VRPLTNGTKRSRRRCCRPPTVSMSFRDLVVIRPFSKGLVVTLLL
jgi:hypothetical protein